MFGLKRVCGCVVCVGLCVVGYDFVLLCVIFFLCLVVCAFALWLKVIMLAAF